MQRGERPCLLRRNAKEKKRGGEGRGEGGLISLSPPTHIRRANGPPLRLPTLSLPFSPSFFFSGLLLLFFLSISLPLPFLSRSTSSITLAGEVGGILSAQFNAILQTAALGPPVTTIHYLNRSLSHILFTFKLPSFLDFSLSHTS